MPDQMSARDRAYLDLLHHGLVLLRNFAKLSRPELSRIEAEHLHEIPTLVGETNEHRHMYYLTGHRDLYLSSLQQLGATDYLEQVTIFFSEPWRVLCSAAGIDS